MELFFSMLRYLRFSPPVLWEPAHQLKKLLGGSSRLRLRQCGTQLRDHLVAHCDLNLSACILSHLANQFGQSFACFADREFHNDKVYRVYKPNQPEPQQMHEIFNERRMRILKEAKPTAIYQLKMTLRYTRPPIWRRVEVQSDITLAKLHRIVQTAMGWYDSHLHQFIVGDTYYGVPSIDDLSEVKDERKVRLDQILSRPGRKIVYEYDFGDGWEHDIVLEKVVPSERAVRYPRCTGGARACPPEDCGGTGGYENFLSAICDPDHEEHEEMLEWIGGEFDPEAFELEDFNAALRQVR